MVEKASLLCPQIESNFFTEKNFPLTKRITPSLTGWHYLYTYEKISKIFFQSIKMLIFLFFIIPLTTFTIDCIYYLKSPTREENTNNPQEEEIQVHQEENVSDEIHKISRWQKVANIGFAMLVTGASFSVGNYLKSHLPLISTLTSVPSWITYPMIGISFIHLVHNISKKIEEKQKKKNH